LPVAKQQKGLGAILSRYYWDLGWFYLPDFIEIGQAISSPGQVEDPADKYTYIGTEWLKIKNSGLFQIWSQ